jgi:hypothetical protein
MNAVTLIKVTLVIAELCFTSGMSNRGSAKGHLGHICVVMRATHDN